MKVSINSRTIGNNTRKMRHSSLSGSRKSKKSSHPLLDAKYLASEEGEYVNNLTKKVASLSKNEIIDELKKLNTNVLRNMYIHSYKFKNPEIYFAD